MSATLIKYPDNSDRQELYELRKQFQEYKDDTEYKDLAEKLTETKRSKVFAGGAGVVGTFFGCAGIAVGVGKGVLLAKGGAVVAGLVVGGVAAPVGIAVAVGCAVFGFGSYFGNQKKEKKIKKEMEKLKRK